ncbi:peripherin-2-like [Anoplophora glabripennis]|uniref:peripherin-2-like n=1 Tax=Anoplophora glabripennis TaxID=217634 RepID=UPI0008753870|nr:peripherin-2-like [Anoplophora glabripennis]
MAVGMFKLTQKQRKHLYVIFITLNIIQILLGFGMTSSSIYIFVAVSPVLHTEKAQINFAFVVTGIYGTHVIFHWLIGIKIGNKCFQQAHKKSTSNLLLLWNCAGTNTVVILIVISHFARKSSKQIIKSMRNSIGTGIIHYLTDQSWKEIIDKLQYSNECCGIDSYENWHETTWLTKYHVDVDSESVKNFRSSQDNLHLPVTPWSCCRINFPMQCLHDPLQQPQYAHLWVDEPDVVKDSINTKGCVEGIKKPILVVINLFVVFTTFVFILHILIVIISRILYTASRNAILLQDPEGTAPGWLFGRGDCGYARGKTLTEIMGLSPRPSGLVLNKGNEKKFGGMNFGKMIPKRFKRNKNKTGSDADQNEESEILLRDDTPIDSIDEFNLLFHSKKLNDTMLDQNTSQRTTDDQDDDEPFSMETEMKKMEV